jgi:RNA polymerase subunit RPABC4/transcription elongation factor Spt4
MAKKVKACKKCKILVDEERCPRCNGTDFTDSWKGKIVVLNAQESQLAKEMKIDKDGEYVIKIK